MKIVPAAVTQDAIRAIERVREKSGDPWSVPFVLDCIRRDYAGLFEVRDEGHVAWMVVERMDQGEVWLNVWILEGAGLEKAEAIFPLIDDLARSVGASRWRCTGRKGWAKWLRPVATVYERKCT